MSTSTPTDTPREAARALINDLFDTIKGRHGLTSDGALARHIGVPEMYIWRWRRGAYGTSTSVLLPLILAYGPLSQSAAPAQSAETAA